MKSGRSPCHRCHRYRPDRQWRLDEGAFRRSRLWRVMIRGSRSRFAGWAGRATLPRRDVAEADEAVQDAFVKVFTHISSYRETWPFEVWFTRILINGCLDRRKARIRRDRWFVPTHETGSADAAQTV